MSEFLRTSLKYSAEIITGIALTPALSLGIASNIIEKHGQIGVFRAMGWLVGRSCTVLLAVSAIPLIIVGIAKVVFFSLLNLVIPCSKTFKNAYTISHAQLQQSTTIVFGFIAILINMDVIKLFFDFRNILLDDDDQPRYSALYSLELAMDNLDIDPDLKKIILTRLEHAFIKFDHKKVSIPSVDLDDLNTPPSVDSPKDKPGKIDKPKTPSPKNRPPTPPGAPGVIVIPEDAKDSPNSSPSPLPEILKDEKKKVKSLNPSPNPSDSKPSPEKGEEGYDLMPDFVKNLFKRPKSA